MVNFPTRIPGCDFDSPALLDLFLSSDASICSTMAFPPLENSGHVVVSVSIDVPSNSQRDALFHRIAYDYFCADWDGLPDWAAIPPLFNGPEVLFSTSDKAKSFAENFSKNSNLDDSGISLPVFPSSTDLKLHNISVTPKMVKNVTTSLDLSKAPGPACIPVVLLKNCEPEISFILAELFSKCLKGSCFPDCWKVSSVLPIFKNVEERSSAKNYRPVSLLFRG